MINEVCQGTQLTLSSGTIAVHTVNIHNTTPILTLLTCLGILDVRHGFRAEGPDGNSQLSHQQQKNTRIVLFFLVKTYSKNTNLFISQHVKTDVIHSLIFDEKSSSGNVSSQLQTEAAQIQDCFVFTDWHANVSDEQIMS